MTKFDIKRRKRILWFLGSCSFLLFLIIQFLGSDNDVAKVYFLCFSVLCFFIVILFNVSFYLRKKDFTV